jgi:Sec-independent protein translocase protein TatA
MLNLDPAKLLVIAVVAIILLGPDAAPGGPAGGGAWRTFNEFRHRMESEVRNSMPDLPSTSEIARLARSPSALLNHLSNMASDEEPDGSFQPPNLNDGNGAADTVADVADVPPAPAEADGGLPHMPCRSGSRRRHAPPATPTIPAPIPVARPPRAPQPSGVVVPGDPTLN